MTVYGSSAGQPGYTMQGSVQAVDQWFGGINIFRAFDSDFPATWSQTGKAKYTPAGAICWHSFKSPSIVAASTGQHNAAMYNFLASIPLNQTVWITMNHEPEDNASEGQFTAAQWRSAQNHLFDQVDQIIQDTGRTNMLKTTVLMSYTMSANDRNIEDWYVSRIDIMGFDNYKHSHLVLAADYADTKNKPWALAEWSSKDPPAQDDAAMAAWIADESDWWTNTIPNPPEAVCYFESTVGANYVITPTANPLSVAAWRSLVTTGDVTSPIGGSDTGGTGGPVSSGPPEGGLLSNVVYVQIGGGGLASGDYDYEDPVTRPNTGWWVEIRDFFDPSIKLAALHTFTELSFTRPLNDVGSGQVTFSKADPIVQIMLPTEDSDEGRGLLTFPSYWSFYHDGAERFRMVYEGKTREAARPDAPENVTITGSGRAVELGWGVVLPKNWPTNDKARPRRRNDSVWADLFVTLFREAKDRGEIDGMSLSFTATHDSYGMPWQILGDREVEIGSSLLDVLQTAADVEEFDWVISPKGKIHAAPELGQDLSDSVRFFQAVNVNEVARYEDRRDVRTRIYVEGNTGRISMVEGEGAQSRWGIRAMYLRSEEAKTQRQRLRVARGTLRQTKRPQRERSVKVPIEQRDPVSGESYGRTLFVDYGLGDTIGLGPKIDNETGDPKPSRDVKVQEIGIRVADGQTEVELLFEARAERMAERARRLLQQRFGAWSSAKTARQGKTPVANMRDTDAEFPEAGETLVYDPEGDEGNGLWKNGRPTDVWPFWFVNELEAVVSKMYFTCDANRTIRRVTARLGDPSTSGSVILSLKRNDIVVHTMTVPAGAKRQREIVTIPVTPNDDLSVDVISVGTGSGNLQFICEAG